MNEQQWYCPEVNEDGFIPLPKLRRRLAELSRRQLQESYPAPALLVLDHDSSPVPVPASARASGAAAAESSCGGGGVRLLTEVVEGVAILRYLNKVAFVAKRPGNPYAHLVSIGRSQRNDIVVAVESVSKLHGYFVADGASWAYVDHGSTNGSKLNDAELEAGRQYPLSEGDRLQLGLDVVLELTSPERLRAPPS